MNLSKQFVEKSKFHFIISIRTFKSITSSNFIELYKDNKIAMLNPENNIKVVIVTTLQIYNFLSKIIKESHLISYIITGDTFEMLNWVRNFKKKI